MNQYYSQKVTDAQALGGHRLLVTFADGFSAEIDLTALLDAGLIFSPLRDPVVFAQAKVNSEWGIIEWPGEIDLSPGSLRAWCEAGHFLSLEETDEWVRKHGQPETHSAPMGA